jgi:beta-aspartyl-peptidase (threonine type)
MERQAFRILMHGGAINPADAIFTERLLAAATIGFRILRDGGTALDAVAYAVAAAEDDPVFNAGTGAHLTLGADAEMDASIMNGADLSAGAVGCITRVKNPILVARKVMEESDHVLLVGPASVRFARLLDFPDYDPITEQRKSEYDEAIRRLRQGEIVPGRSEYWPRLRRWLDRTAEMADTVGAVAVDATGNVAAATSSGGFPLKMPGRVGDTPIIGAGTYADNEKGAVSVTGQGEAVLKLGVAKTVCDLMGNGVGAEDAASAAITQWNRRFPNLPVALVAIDREGHPGAARNIDLTPHVEMSGPMGEVRSNWSAPRQ